MPTHPIAQPTNNDEILEQQPFIADNNEHCDDEDCKSCSTLGIRVRHTGATIPHGPFGDPIFDDQKGVLWSKFDTLYD